MHHDIYIDNSSTTRAYNEVNECMIKVSSKFYGNPSSLHRKGLEAEKLINNARKKVSEALSVEPSEITFTSGGTESNNMAIMGYLIANPRAGKHIITVKTEHPSILETYKHLGKNGYTTDFLDVDENGKIDVIQLKKLLSGNTAFVSIMMVNNETGVIQDIQEITKICRAVNENVIFHVDAVQAFGKLPVKPKQLNIDMLSASGHKIHGPKGTGFLYIKRKIRVKPLIFGGGQENGLRSGTENVPGICGLGISTDITISRMSENLEKVILLNQKIRKLFETSGLNYKILSPEDSLPYIFNVSFPGLKSEVLLHHLEQRGVYVSSGSACSAKRKTKSHVLSAMGYDTINIDSAIRFSFSALNSDKDIVDTVEILKETVPMLLKNNKPRG